MKVSAPAAASKIVPDDVPDLLTHAAEGQEAALAELYLGLKGRVTGLCRYLLRSPDQAEDVAADVLLRLRRLARDYDGRQDFAAWVLRVAASYAVIAWLVLQASAFDSCSGRTIRKGERRLERRNLRRRVRHRGKKRRPNLAWSRRQALRLSCVGSARNDERPQKRFSQNLPAARNHLTGGATAASVWPLALSALATKPEAFISSMNSRR